MRMFVVHIERFENLGVFTRKVCVFKRKEDEQLTILKRGCLAVFMFAILMAILPGMVLAVSAQEQDASEAVSANSPIPDAVQYTGEELIERTLAAYQGAKEVSGFWGFNGRCSTLVNSAIVALGINEDYHSCDGKEVYDIYENMTHTNTGYEVICYGAEEYGLEEALNAVSENGTRNVYNLVIGWQGGRTGASSKHGHTCMIQGIVDGMVYFCESFGLEIADKFYAEGKPIVCTIAEFSEFYNKWAYFEGLIHFEYPDVVAPHMTEMETSLISSNGFTLKFEASDNVGIVDIYARVWRYGETEDDAVTVPVTMVGNKAWIRINTADFANYDGKYYVNCYAADRKGNVTVIGMAEDGLSLYEAEKASGVYRVEQDSVGIHNAPYSKVNETCTREAAIDRGVDVTVSGSIINADGELWYQLTDGGWIYSEDLRPVYTWAEVWNSILAFLNHMISG